MTKTPVKQTVCPFAVGLLGTSCRGSELFQSCKTEVRNVCSCIKLVSVQKENKRLWQWFPSVWRVNWDLPFYLLFSFPAAMQSVTWVGQNEWVRNPKSLPKLVKRLRTMTFRCLHLFVRLCTMGICPWIKGTQYERLFIWYFWHKEKLESA